MKDLTIEQKAKRYDEALGKAEIWHNAPNVDKIPTLVFINKNKQIINTISKDEDILDDVIHANLEILAENYL